MKCKILSIALLVALILSGMQGHAQSESSLLWEISGNGLSQKSYIFGTIHIIDKANYFVCDSLKKCLKNCDILVTEVNLKIPLTEQLNLMNKLYLPDGRTIQSYLSEADYKLFKTYLLDTFQIDQSKFDKYVRIKPFFLISILIKEQGGKMKSYEKELLKMANNQGLSTGGLESVDEQLALINNTPIEQQAAEIIDMLKNYKESMNSYHELVSTYITGNLDELYKKMLSDSTFNDDFKDSFLTKRNNKWVPVMEKAMKQYRCFFAVGSAHLPEQDGVLNLLRKKGYNVRPMYCK
jgi:uncharacterized protein YbaP (TraB family)